MPLQDYRMQLGHGWPRMVPSSRWARKEWPASMVGSVRCVPPAVRDRLVLALYLDDDLHDTHTAFMHPPCATPAALPWPLGHRHSTRLSLSVCPASLPPKLLEAFASDRDRPRPTGDNQSMQMRSDPPERGTDHCFLFGIGIGIGGEDRSRIGTGY